VKQKTQQLLNTTSSMISQPKEFLNRKRRRYRLYIIVFVILGFMWLCRPYAELALHSIRLNTQQQQIQTLDQNQQEQQKMMKTR
jgi:hypothetical protein